jgi:hypothetical protein
MTSKKYSDPAFLAEWVPTTSGDAGLELSAVFSGKVPALQMDFDFKAGGGFVVAKRAFNRSMPEDYTVHCRLRGRGGAVAGAPMPGAVITLEVKLIDATGRNVWRFVKKDLALPARWTRMTVESRDIDFGWGPAGGGAIGQLGSIEFAIVSSTGGSGTLWIADIQIDDSLPAQAPTSSASSELSGFAAAGALAAAGWRPRPDDARPWLVIDFSAPRRLGGLIIDWLDHAPPSGFRIRGSNTATRWKTLHAAARAGGPRSYVYLPGTQVRFLRVEFADSSVGAALRVQSFEFSRSIEAFWYRVAQAEPRGWHPRWLHREQSTWTPIGTSHGSECALMNDDGMVEVSQGSFCVEPMLRIAGRLVTWADVTARQELEAGWMPVPAVIWETREWRLRILAETTQGGVLRVRYRIDNLTDREMSARLFVLVRPFQVTPPWQSFREVGGVSRVTDVEYREGAVRVNGKSLIVPVAVTAAAPAASTPFAALSFDEGFMAARLSSGMLPPNSQAHDPFGFATGALQFDLSPTPHEAGQVVIHCMAPVASRSPAAPTGNAGPLDAAQDATPTHAPTAVARHSAAEPAFDWRAKLPVSQWSGNGWMTDAIHAALTATAQILVTRSGPALQPGPRRYTRSWIRDGAMMSAALLRMGLAEEVREFIRWYAPTQRADGFVPCCVDREGIDWLVEHDSHGQLIALIADHYRFSGDRALLEECWLYVDRAVGYIERVQGPNGLLPISVSHEGYLAQPVHSYWDDFWGLKGLRDAVDLAQTLGHEDSARHWQTLSTRFADSLFTSIEDTRARRRLDFIPGSIEWADFDPTATANALYLFDVPQGLNRGAVQRTFEKYLTDWRAKRSGALDWSNYTPYEIRIIGALVRLGMRDAALELLRFFLSDRRPPPWNQWPEIAWRDHAAPAHIGDLPHTWIAAEYVLALRSLIAYEREADRSLILAAGLAPEWIEGAGVAVDGMPTLHGRLSYSLRRIDARTLRFEISSALAGPVILRPPLPAPLSGVTVDGSPSTSFDDHSVTLAHTPAIITCTT